MKKMTILGITGFCASLLLSACGGGGGGGATTVFSKAETRAYLFCAMSSNSRIVSVESSFKVPAGIEVAYYPQTISDSPTVFSLESTVISAPLFSGIGSASGTFDTNPRSLKYTLFNPPAASSTIASNTIDKGLEIATFTFSFTANGVNPTSSFPTADTTPTVGKAISNDISNLSGCTVNYVTTYK